MLNVEFTAITFLAFGPLLVWGGEIDGKGLLRERPDETRHYGTGFLSIFFENGYVEEKYPHISNDQ